MMLERDRDTVAYDRLHLKMNDFENTEYSKNNGSTFFGVSTLIANL